MTKPYKRHPHFLSHLDPKLMANIKLFAVGRQIPLWKAIHYLLTQGLRHESEHPGKVDDFSNPYIVQVVPRFVIKEEKEEYEEKPPND